jgi:hypothetical protein
MTRRLNRVAGIWMTAVVLCIASVASAVVTDVAVWRLGEDDTGAVNGANGQNPTTPLVNAQSLTLSVVQGTPTYSSDVNAPVSTLSMEFNPSTEMYGTGVGAISGLTDNYGVEMWVKLPSIAGWQTPFSMGSSSSLSLDVACNAGNWQVLRQGDAFWTGSAAATAGAWTHLAVIIEGGTGKFFVNGTQVATGGAPGNFDALGIATIYYGGAPNNGNTMVGWIDDIRIFSFSAGEFSTGDLNYPQHDLSADPDISVPASLAFGSVVESTSSNLNLAVSNLGTAETMPIASALLISGDVGMFSVVSTPPAVSPGATSNIVVQYLPTAAAGHSAVLQITSGDRSNPTTNVTLTGTGTPSADDPNIVVDATLAFGSVDTSSSSNLTFDVENDGATQNLTPTAALLSGDMAHFTIVSQPGTVSAGTTNTMVVNYRPLGALGSHSAVMRLTSNDPSQSTVDVTLTGTGTGYGTISTWRLGEDDSGAVSGAAGQDPTTALRGSLLMNVQAGGPIYTNDTPSGNSTLAAFFDDVLDNYGTDLNTITGVTDNWGVECWVKPSYTSGWGVPIAMTQGSSSSCLFIGFDGSRYRVEKVGVAGLQGPVMAPNTWAHVAYTVTGTAVDFYVNGNFIGTYDPGSSVGSPKELMIGGIWYNGAPNAGNNFGGAIDDVRIFTFAPGGFDSNTLNTTQGDLSTVDDPDIAVSTTTLAFGTLATGGNSNLTMTVSNNGALNNLTTSATLVSGDTAQFTIVSQPSAVVPVTTSNIVVRYNPSSAGSHSAVLRITSNDSSDPAVDVALSGSSTDDPNIAAPGSLAFGTMFVGSTSNLNLAVTNDGATLNLTSSAALVSGDTTQFSIIDQPSAIVAGTTSNILVQYAPTAAAGHSAVLRITSNDPSDPTTDVTLTGTGTQDDPNIVVASAVNFGNVDTGANSNLNVSVENNGATQDLTPTAAIVSGDTARFTIISQAGTVSAGQTNDIVVNYRPGGALGSHSAVLRITSNDAGDPTVDVTLNGTGTGYGDVAVWRLGDDDSGAVNGANGQNSTTPLVNAQSLTLSVVQGTPTYSSDVNAPVSTLSMEFNPSTEMYGTGVGAISGLTDNYGVEMWVKLPSTAGWQTPFSMGSAASGSTDVSCNGGTWSALTQGVGFWSGGAAATAGAWTHLAVIIEGGTGRLFVDGVQAATGAAPTFDALGIGTIYYNGAPNNGNTIVGWIDDIRVFTFAPGSFGTSMLNYPQGDLSAVDDPDIFVASSLGFGTISSGATSNLNLKVSNQGVINNLTPSAALVSGDTTQFTIVSQPSAVVAGGTSNIVVRYNPSAVGGHSAVLRITSNDGNDPTVDVTLTGTAIDDPNISVPASLAFDDVEVGSNSNLNLAVGNTGASQNLTPSASLVSGDTTQFTIVSQPSTVVPGATSNIVVRYSPSAAGSHSAVLRVASNDGSDPTVDVTLTGSGVQYGFVATWRLGEDDSGALAGNPGQDPTTAFEGSLLLKVQSGAPAYSGDTPVSAASSSSMFFDKVDDNYGTDLNTITGLTDNWGMECWAKPNYTSGWGVPIAMTEASTAGCLFIGYDGSRYKVEKVGVAGLWGPVMPADTWTHIAYTVTGNLVDFYVNGSLIGTYNSGSAIGNPKELMIGGIWYNGAPNAGNNFGGLIDDVRIFTFAPGSFDPSGLNYPQQDLDPQQGTLFIIK